MKTGKIFIIIGGIQASMDVGEKCQLSKLFTHSASRRQAEHKSDFLSPSKCLYWLLACLHLLMLGLNQNQENEAGSRHFRLTSFPEKHSHLTHTKECCNKK